MIGPNTSVRLTDECDKVIKSLMNEYGLTFSQAIRYCITATGRMRGDTK